MKLPDPSPGRSCSTLGLLFRQLREGMWARMEDELTRLGHDLTFSQFVTIKKLAAGVASVTDLARAAELNPGAMTRLLDKLAAKELITRVDDPDDRRALHIHLTKAGLAIWKDLDQCAARVRERALAGLDEQDRDTLMRLLGQVQDNLSHPDSQ